MSPSPTELGDASAEAAGSRGFTSRHARAALASLVLLVGFGWLLHKGRLPYLPPRGALAGLNFALFLCFLGGMLFHMLTRFGRCYFLIRPIADVPLRRLLTINAIGTALVTLLPLRLGEFARPAMLREKGHLSAWAVMGTVAAERILDGLVFGGLLLLGLGLAPHQEPLPNHVGSFPVSASLVPIAGRLASLGFGAAFLVMAAFFWYRAQARRLTERLVGLVSKSLAVRIADIVERVSDGLRFLVNPRHTIPYLSITVISIAGHVFAIQWLAQAVGLPELTFAQSMVVVGVLALGFAAPNAPGFFGAVQLAMYAGLAVYVAEGKIVQQGAVMVFLFYVSYLGIVMGLAAVALVVEYAVPALLGTSRESAA